MSWVREYSRGAVKLTPAERQLIHDALEIVAPARVDGVTDGWALRERLMDMWPLVTEVVLLIEEPQ